MADPITWIATAFAKWAAAAAVSAGASATTASFVYAAAYATAYVATTAAVTAGLGAIARAQLPDPEGGKITRKQARPPRQRVIGGPSRFSGAYMLRETNANNLAVVLALAEGRLHEISRVYLNDDVAVIDSNGWVLEGDDRRYGFQRVRLDWRLGLPNEDHYSLLTPKFGSVWPTTARGDGIASLMMLCNHGSMEYFSRDFPNGEPIPSVVGQGVCYDWRDETQDRADESTWQPSSNPVVWLVHLEWFLWGRSWSRCIEPYLDDLTAEADYCDETVATLDGFEPRYRFAGNFFSNTEPDAIRTGILASMDGWLSTNGKGGLVIKAGRYEEPTFTITGEHIEGYTWRAFQTDEEAVNELVVSYVSPDHHYTEVECDPWRDEAGITATGKIRSENLQLLWVNHHTQARRLAKRKMSRLAALRRGQIRTGIYGLNGLGQRYIRVQNPELSSMADVVVEVTNVEVDFASGQVAFDVMLADQNIDEWDPATEEGNPVGTVSRPGAVPLAPPTIDNVEVFYDAYGSPRLRITAAGPDRDDILWRIGYRVPGDEAFVESSATDLDPSTPVLLESGLVPQGDLEVIVGYQTGAGTLSWMDGTDAVSVSTNGAPSPPTDVQAEVVGANVEISWRNPASLNLSYLKVFRGATNVFADATDISSAVDHTGIGAPQTYAEVTPAAGTWYYWVVAYSTFNVDSLPGGPAELVVFDTEALAVIAAHTTPPDESRALLINSTVTRLKTAASGNLWAIIGKLAFTAAADSQAALIDWKNPGGTPFTTSGSPTFTADEGFTGGTSKQIDSGAAVNAFPGLTQNSNCFFAYVVSGTTAATRGLWGIVSSQTVRGNLATSGALATRNSDNTGSPLVSAGAATVVPGLYAGNRSGATAREAYKNGVLVGSDTLASATPPSDNLLFGNMNNNFADGVVFGLVGAGGSMNAAQQADFYAIAHDWMVGVGAV